MSVEPILSSATPSALRRISWGAVWAGMFVVLAVDLMLFLLCLGISAGNIHVGGGNGPGISLGIGAAIGFAVASWIGLYLGCWVAGKMAGVPRNSDGALHGFVTWGFSTIVLAALLIWAVGEIAGGAATLVKKIASVASNPAITSTTLGGITGETPAQVRQQAADVIHDPAFRTFLADVLHNGNVPPADKQALVTDVANRRSISDAQAETIVSGWQQDLQNAKTTGTNVANAAASGTSTGGIWLFVAMIIGLVVSCWGGAVGAPEDSSLIPITRGRP